MYFRVKKTGLYPYLQIVESFRDGKCVRQRVLATLGRLDILQTTGQLDRLLESGARFCERLAVIDAHAAGRTEAVAVRKIGPDLVFGRLWQELKIPAVLKELLQGRRYDFDVERAIYLTVLHRLFASGSDRAADTWREGYKIPGTEKLDLHHQDRAMAFLGTPLRDGPHVLGRPRCVKDLVEEALFENRRDLFSTVDLVFFDTTSIDFEGQGGQSLGRHGHSKDHRPDLRQMIVGIVLDAEGCPLCCEMWPGNTTDVRTLLPIIDRMKKRFVVKEVCVVADRGMISQETVQQMEAATPPVRYILGARMRRQKEVSQDVLHTRSHWVEVTPERKVAKDPAPLKVREAFVADRRYVICLNEEEKRKDAYDRRAIIEALRKQLKKGDKSLVGHKGFRRYLRREGDGHFAVDEEQVLAEARFDGVWVLTTNTDWDMETVALVYKKLWMVEDIFRTAKSILETRPIFHKRDETIRGHVFCSFLALLLKKELEDRLLEQNSQWEWAQILRGLDNLHEVEAVFQGKRFLLRSQLHGDAHQAIRAAAVAIPPTLRQL